MNKRSLALLIVLLLVMTLLPGTALADEPEIWIVASNDGLFEIGDAAELTADSVEFSATSYQWYSNTTDDFSTATLIGGATNNTYSPSTGMEGLTFYFCEASDGTITKTVGMLWPLSLTLHAHKSPLSPEIKPLP